LYSSYSNNVMMGTENYYSIQNSEIVKYFQLSI